MLKEYQADSNSVPGKSSKVTPLTKRAVLFGLLTFIVLALIIGILTYQRFLTKLESRNIATREFVIGVKDKLQESLAQSISATKTLAFFIKPDGTVQQFDSIASLILNANKDVDALELVPDGVITAVYPREGNEAVIGYNILKDPTRNKEAFKAIEKRELFFAGPFALKQGGLGVVGRLPIFRQDKFWGFSAVIIKVSTLLKSAGIDTSGANEFYFQLSKINPDTKKEEFFISNPTLEDTSNSVSVIVPDGEWRLSATRKNEGAGYADILWLGLLGFLFSVMGGVFVYLFASRPERLGKLVKTRTAELAESEERYRSLIEQASDGIIVYSFDGTIHQFNKQAYIESGYTKEEFSKLNLKDLLSEKEMNMRQSNSEAIRSGKTAMLERKLIRKDGSLADIEINVRMLPDDSLLAFVRNTTERKNAEKALKESEEKFSRVFQSDLVGLAISDENTIITDANEYFAALLELSTAEIIGKIPAKDGLLSKIIHTKRNSESEKIASLVRENGRLKNYEIEIEKSNGQVKALLISIEPLDLNNRHHWLTTVIDITEKKNAELLLVASEKKYRSLIEQASDGIVISDLQGNIMEVNKSICKMTGYPPEEMIGRPVNDFIPPTDVIEKPLRIADLLAGKSLLYERRIQRKNGEVVEVEVNSKMASDSSLIGFIRDITERKKAEEELKTSNERFELIARATNDAIWHHDFSTNEVTGNDNLYSLYGFTKGVDKITGDVFAVKAHPEDMLRVRQNFTKALSEKASSITEEFRFKTPDGNYKIMYNRSYLVYDEQGRPVQIMGVMQDITARVNNEQAILREKELSDSIINSLPAVFYLYNAEGKFLRWNKNFELVTGYDSEEMKHLHPLDFFEGVEKEVLDEKIRNVFVEGKDSVEANFFTKDKRKIPYYFSGMKIDYEGQSCLMGFGLDFTHKVESQRAIKDSEEKFRNLVEEASDGVAILTLAGQTLYVSPAAIRIMGYTEAELINLNWFELTHVDDVNGVKKIFTEAMENPGIAVKGSISRVLHKDGTWRSLERTITNLHHIPSINGIVQNFRDVTEKLEIEKNRMAEKELSDSIINSLPGIFYLYDNTGRFIRWNQNFETLTGYSAEEIRQMHPVDFYEESQQTRIRQRIRDVLKNKKIEGAEFTLLTKNQSRIPFLYNSTMIEYEGMRCVMGMGFDVTDRKRIEQQLLISHQSLEKKAAELVSSYSELEQFAYIVSHDLQEPLRMVSSFLKLFEKKYKGTLDETGEKYIHYAVDGAERMKQLIMDLLEYSRTGTNKDVVTNTDMNEVMADVLAVLKNPITETNAAIMLQDLPVLPHTSKTQMFQLMQNLLGNALKYRGTTNPIIEISAEERAGEWLFAVKDNGIGIDPKFSDKVFLIFQRLHAKNEFSGTGVGLSICKKIVEKHGGKIWVEPNEAGGSIFYFTIRNNPS
jgi:PAS domain S-box-containing protein